VVFVLGLFGCAMGWWEGGGKSVVFFFPPPPLDPPLAFIL